MNASDHCELIELYVDVCNQALSFNKHRFPFKQILGTAQDVEKGCVVEVNIMDTVPLESFIFKLEGDGISVKPHGICRNCKCDRTWNVSASYLEDVTRDPQTFIQNPAKMNWEWMYDVRN